MSRQRVRRPAPGYLRVAAASAGLGLLGVIPFVLLGYALVQWVLAPLGLASADSSDDDGAAVLIVAGVLVPLGLVAGWAAVVRRWLRSGQLVRPVGWTIAVIMLALPTLVFALVR